MAAQTTFSGSCHCGNAEVTLVTAKRPDELGVRACACSFCRRHGARTTTDPEGRAMIRVRDAARLNRYRFNLHSADFLVCRDCGTYLGAVYSEAGRAWVTLNVNAFQNRDDFPAEASPVVYDSETAADRAARRKARWTPLEWGETLGSREQSRA